MRIGHACRYLVTVLAFTLAGPLWAQTGTIGGRVVDAGTSAGIPFAQVTAVSATGGVAGTARTDDDGNFRIQNVPAGTYTLVVLAIGYGRTTMPGATVSGTGMATVNVEMARVTLLEVVTVTPSRGAAGEKAQDAVASISVVDAERIAERPSVTVTDHLKSVPGLSINSGGLAQANIVSRGFNNAFSTSMLMLQDYRFAGVPSLRVNVPFLFTGTNEDIERIEVLNGPASALYGPNSANGVLHVITKSPLFSQGTTLTLDGGMQDLFRVSGRHSRKLTDRLGIKISGEYMRATDFEYTDPNEPQVYPSLAPEGRRGEPVERNFDLERMSGEFRADYRFGENTELVSTAGFSRMGSALELTTVFGTVQAKDWTYFNLQERFRHKGFFAQIFFNGSNSGNEDGSDLSGSHYLRTGIPVVDKSTVLVGQAQQAFTLGAIPLVAGFDYIKTTPQTEGTINGRNEDDDNVTEYGAYLQGTVRLTDKLDFVAAARGDKNDRLDGAQFSPRAALVFKPNERHNLRATFNRAFNSPANFTFFLDQIQNPQIAPGFALRAIGNPALEGWQFDRSCDASVNSGLCMRSPYTGGNATLNSDASLVYQGFMQSLPTIVQALPESQLSAAQKAALLGALQNFGPLLNNLTPTSSDLPTTLKIGSAVVSANSVDDIGAINASFNNTYELGYKGIFGKTAVAVDFWRQIRGDVGLPAGQANPGVFYDSASVQAYFQPRMQAALQAQQLPEQQAAQLAAQASIGLASLMSKLPVGSITLDNDLVTDASFIATYKAGQGEVEVSGIDLALEHQLTDRIMLEGTYSFLSKIVFPEAGGEVNPLMSNSPKHRATTTARYRNEEWGFGAEARIRYSDAFPINSGVFNSLGIPPNNPGTFLYPPPGATTQFDLGVSKRFSVGGRQLNWSLFGQNLADDDTPTFVGVPAVGRMVSTRLQYVF